MSQSKKRSSNFVTILLVLVIGVILVIIGMRYIKIVPSGEDQVLFDKNGKITELLEPGVHFAQTDVHRVTFNINTPNTPNGGFDEDFVHDTSSLKKYGFYAPDSFNDSNVYDSYFNLTSSDKKYVLTGSIRAEVSIVSAATYLNKHMAAVRKNKELSAYLQSGNYSLQQIALQFAFEHINPLPFDFTVVQPGEGETHPIKAASLISCYPLVVASPDSVVTNLHHYQNILSKELTGWHGTVEYHFNNLGSLTGSLSTVC